MELHGDEAVVVSERMSFTSGVLTAAGPGSETTQRVRLGECGRHPCGPVRVGDVVAIHWDWVCEVLTPAAALALQQGEAVAIERANRALSVPGAREPG